MAITWPFIEFTNWDLTAWFFVFWANIGAVGPYGAYWAVVFIFFWVWWLASVSTWPYLLWATIMLVIAIVDTIYYIEYLDELNYWYEGKRDTFRWDSFVIDEPETSLFDF